MVMHISNHYSSNTQVYFLYILIYWTLQEEFASANTNEWNFAKQKGIVCAGLKNLDI